MSAAQEIVAALALWVVKESLPAGDFDQAKTALKMPDIALILRISGSGVGASVAFEIAMREPRGKVH